MRKKSSTGKEGLPHTRLLTLAKGACLGVILGHDEELVHVPNVIRQVAQFDQAARQQVARLSVVRQPRLVEQDRQPQRTMLEQGSTYLLAVEFVEGRAPDQL